MVLNHSIPALGGSPIDLVLIHWPCPGYFHGAAAPPCAVGAPPAVGADAAST